MLEERLISRSRASLSSMTSGVVNLSFVLFKDPMPFLSHYPSLMGRILTYSCRKGGTDLVPPWSGLLFSEQLVSGGKDFALLLVGSRPYAGRRQGGRTPESPLFSVFSLGPGAASLWIAQLLTSELWHS